MAFGKLTRVGRLEKKVEELEKALKQADEDNLKGYGITCDRLEAIENKLQTETLTAEYVKKLFDDLNERLRKAFTYI